MDVIFMDTLKVIRFFAIILSITEMKWGKGL